MGRTYRRVASEGQLHGGREDTHGVTIRAASLSDKHRLGKVQLVGNGLHHSGIQAFR